MKIEYLETYDVPHFPSLTVLREEQETPIGEALAEAGLVLADIGIGGLVRQVKTPLINDPYTRF